MINPRFGRRENSNLQVHGVSGVDFLHLERNGGCHWREANVFLDVEKGGRQFDVIVTDPLLETLANKNYPPNLKFDFLLGQNLIQNKIFCDFLEI